MYRFHLFPEVDDSESTILHDVGGMIQELTEDKTMRESQKVAYEKEIIVLVWAILFTGYLLLSVS